jgi:hypothetical protein
MKDRALRDFTLAASFCRRVPGIPRPAIARFDAENPEFLNREKSDRQTQEQVPEQSL